MPVSIGGGRGRNGETPVSLGGERQERGDAGKSRGGEAGTGRRRYV